MFLYYLLIVSVVPYCVDGNCSPCSDIPKHYEELGCKGILHQGDCCPERFECPDFLTYNKSQCHYKGKLYEINDELDGDIGPPCSAACRCLGFSETAIFNCANVECGEFFHPPDANCILQHELNKCCSTKKICDEKEIAKLPYCSLRGKTYRKGEFIYPEFAPCYQCLCNEDFDNSTGIHFNKNCRKIDCGIELRRLNDIQSGCIPVYYGDNGCCPIEYRCPSNSDFVMSHEGRSEPVEETDFTCKFNKFILQKGEQLNSNEKCVQCMCRRPPMVDCVKNPECYNESFNLPNFTKQGTLNAQETTEY